MKIGALADSTGVSTKTLRFYESEGLLPEPQRTPSGYRDYPAEAAARDDFIRQDQASGQKLRQIAENLDNRAQGQAPCEHVNAMVQQRLAEVDERMADLQRIKRELRAIAKRLESLAPADCDKYCRAISQ
jgi:DNA-binding transcriptional MerR regulator